MAKKKRGNGEGSITRYKDGRWCGRYWTQTTDGKRTRVAVYGRTKAEVRVKLTKAIAERDAGFPFETKNPTLKEHLERWLENSVKGNVAPRTFANYKLQVRRHIVPALGHIKLKTLTSSHVQGFYRTKLDSGLSPSSVRYIHAVLRRALKQAVRWRLVPINAAESVDLPQLVHKEQQSLSLEEAKRFLEAARGDRLEALYVLALYTGLRQGELLGLRWDDVDLESGKLRVTRQLQRLRDGSKLAFVPLKNPKSRRTIKISRSAVQALIRHRDRQAKEKIMLGASYKDQGLIFPSIKGTPICSQNVVN
jgi:integrase